MLQLRGGHLQRWTATSLKDVIAKQSPFLKPAALNPATSFRAMLFPWLYDMVLFASQIVIDLFCSIRVSAPIQHNDPFSSNLTGLCRSYSGFPNEKVTTILYGKRICRGV
jgi:hypothetical protein